MPRWMALRTATAQVCPEWRLLLMRRCRCRRRWRPPAELRPLPAAAACAANWYLHEGECFPCIGAATSAGQLDTTCSCAASYTYDHDTAYVHLEGCACATGYTDTSANCTHSDAGWYKVYADGESADNSIGVTTRCPGGATSTAGPSPQCTCDGIAKPPYDPDTAFDPSIGCACFEGYAKPAGDDDGECTECAAGYAYKEEGESFTCTECDGVKVSDGAKDESCSCPTNTQYSGHEDVNGCSEWLPALQSRLGSACCRCLDAGSSAMNTAARPCQLLLP
jgi:hypothetical protein